MIGPLRRWFLAGLLVLIPTTATLYIFYLFIIKVDGILAGIIERFVGRAVPGGGFVTIILFIFLVGLITNNYLGGRLVALGDHFLGRVPLVNRLYAAIKQMSEVFLTDKGRVFRRAVLIEYPRPGLYSVAFVTAEGAACLDLAKNGFQGAAPGGTLHVFLPTTPNPTSGFFLVVPTVDAKPLDLSLEDALKLVISGGAVLPPSHLRPTPGTPAAQATLATGHDVSSSQDVVAPPAPQEGRRS